MKNKCVQKLSGQKLLQYGCNKEGMVYHCIWELEAPDFCAVITYEGQELHTEVYDAQLREPYTPSHVPGANGSSVPSIREEVEELLEDMVQQRIDGNPYRTRILDYVAERYRSYPQLPWKSAPEHGTLKAAKGKWYGVTMHVPCRSLGTDVDGMTDVCNLRNRPEFIQELIDYKCFYPAYRMNKTYRSAILLDQKLSWKQLQKFVDGSYRLVNIGK